MSDGEVLDLVRALTNRVMRIERSLLVLVADESLASSTRTAIAQALASEGDAG